MQLTPRRHELLSCYLLGAGTLFMYLGESFPLLNRKLIVFRLCDSGLHLGVCHPHHP